MRARRWFPVAALVALSTMGPAAAAAVAEDDLNARLEKLNDRVVELEAARELQRVRFSGTLINRFEHFTNRYGLPGADKDKDILRVESLYFALNTDFDVSKRIKLYTTLAMSKFWQNDGRNEYPGNWQASEGGSFGYGGSTPKFDRAYMTYGFDFPLTLAIGRMPTNGGVPTNQLDGLPREGTYPRFAYNAIFDGLAAIYDFSGLLPEGHQFKARAFYTPNVNIDKTTRTRQLKDGAVKIESNDLQYALLGEYSTSRLGRIADRLSVDYMFYQYRNFYNDGANTPDPPGAAPNNPLDSAKAHMLYLGLEGIGGVGLNASLSSLWYNTVETNLDGSDELRLRSYSYLVNVNQTLTSLVPGAVAGFEYIKTDPTYYLDEWTSLNLIPFYYTPASHGWHLFASSPIAEKLRLRVGAYALHSDPYNVVGVRDADEKDGRSYYLQLRLDF